MNKNLRHKLDQHKVNYNPQHWEQLQQRLATHNRRRWFWWKFAVVLVALIGSLLFWWIGNPKVVGTPVGVLQQQDTTSKQANGLVTKPLQVPTETIIATTTSNNEVAKPTLAVDKLSAMPDKKAMVAKKSFLEVKAKNNQKTYKGKQGNKQENGQRNKQKSSQVSKQPTQQQGQQPRNKIVETPAPVQPVASEELPQLITLLQPMGLAPLPQDSIKKLVILPHYQADRRSQLLAAATPKVRRFRIGVVAMGMNTTLRVKDEQQFVANLTARGAVADKTLTQQIVALNMGVLAEYKIGKFSVGTGALFSGYQLNFSDAGTNQVVLDTLNQLKVSSASQVSYTIQQAIIPISLRYDVIDAQEKGKWFVSALLLNHFLLQSTKEESNLAVYNALPVNSNSVTSAPPSFGGNSKIVSQYTQQKSAIEGNLFTPFAGLQLQLGYERALGKHFSYQIEPFIRIALQGETSNKFQISSTGLSLRINYVE